MSQLPFSRTKDRSGRSVPSSRLSRLARFGSMAGGVAGGMLLDGARQLAQGKRPSLTDLLLTPANAVRVTHPLAHLRGAAMKMGQLMSMDGGDFLPAELSEIMGRLRADAEHMPQSQLQAVLDLRWGPGWQDRFTDFGFTPIAAASIGQVHRATTSDGRDLAIKVQYPGVRASIDSDVGNVGTLMKMSGLLPATLDIAPMLAEARRQLHEEADYEREARYLARFGTLLTDAPDFIVPALHADFTRPSVLVMSYVEGMPVESLETAPQAERDRVMTLLITLLLRELFEFALMQTDPNFANYRYQPATQKLVLLDFGASREIAPTLAADYRRLLHAGFAGDGAAARQAMLDLGFFDARTRPHHQEAVLAAFEAAMAPMRTPGLFDFGDQSLPAQLREQGMELAADREFWHIPPIDTLFLQRKFGGLFLLGSRLKARVDLRALFGPYL